MARQLVIDIVGDASKFSKSVGDATKSAGGLGTVMKGVGLGLGAGAFGLATSAVSGFVSALGDAGQAYRDDQASQALLANTLKNTVPGWDGNTAAVEAYAAAQGRLGFADDDIRTSIGQLIGITHDQTKAMELNSIAQDLARAKGIDLGQATDIVTKAAQGNGKALKAMGIDIAGATDAAGMLDAIQQNAKGSAEAWAATSEGKVAAANVKQGEAWEKIGSVVDKFSSAILPIVADAFSTVADVIVVVSDAVSPLITQVVEGLTPAFQAVMSFVSGTVIPILTQVFKTVLPPLSAAVGVVGGVFRSVFGFIASFVGTEIGIVTGIVNGVIGVFNGVSDTIRDVAKNVGDAVGNIVGFFTGIGSRISAVTAGMWDGIFGAFRSVINSIIKGWNSIKFTLPEVDLGPLGKVGGFTIGTPDLPYLHTGGIVPGRPGQDVVAMLQAGERVIGRGPAGDDTRTVNINLKLEVTSPDGSVSALDKSQIAEALNAGDFLRSLEHMASVA